MDERTQKEKVLTQIRHAILNKEKTPYPEVDLHKNFFASKHEEEIVLFAQNFIGVGGQFVYCDSIPELIESIRVLIEEKKITYLACFDQLLSPSLKEGGIAFYQEFNQIKESNACLTRCEYLIARFGSILVSSNSGSGRRAHIYPESHLVVASVDQIVGSVHDALKGLKLKYSSMPSQMAVITGPSRTADIEKTLVKPAHGPKNLFLFLLPEDKFSSL